MKKSLWILIFLVLIIGIIIFALKDNNDNKDENNSEDTQKPENGADKTQQEWCYACKSNI